MWINHTIKDVTDFRLAEPLWESIADGFGLAYLAEALLGKPKLISRQLKEKPQFRIQVWMRHQCVIAVSYPAQRNSNVKIVLDEFAATGVILLHASGLDVRPEGRFMIKLTLSNLALDITDGDRPLIVDVLWVLFNRFMLSKVQRGDLHGEVQEPWCYELVSLNAGAGGDLSVDHRKHRSLPECSNRTDP